MSVQAIFKKFRIASAAGIAFLCAVLCSCILGPIYTAISNDVLYMATPFPVIVRILTLFFDAAYLAVCIAVIASAAFLTGGELPRFRGTLITVAVVVFFKHASNAAAAAIDGAFSDGFDFVSVLVNVIADLLVCALSLLIGCRYSLAARERLNAILKASRYIDAPHYDILTGVFPFPRFISLSNPVLRPAFYSALLYSAFGLLSRLIYDLGLGAPLDAAETAEMIFGYLSDLVLGLVFYTIAYFTAAFILSGETEKTHKQ